MPKKADRIITSVYLTKEMCGQIDKLADREHISRNEQIRRFIKKGLTVDGYTEDIDFIASIIRQEFTAVYHIGDITAVVEQQTNRLAKMLMKSGKMDAAAFFLLIKVLMNVAHDGTQDEFDQITGNMKEGLVLLDGMGRILSINPAARILFGAGIACVGEDFLTIDRKQNMRMALEEANAQGHADFRTKKNGREYQFDLSRIDSDGNNHGMVILAFDITEQVNAEKHRQEFTANASHELKTPLQSIIGSAELMENGIVKAEDVPRFVGHIRKEASRLVFLIDDIIRLSELDEGAEMPHEDVSLKVLSEEVCETLADAAKLKDVSLEVSGDDGVINGVRRLLYEVVYNLCDNAIKYNNPGGSVKVNVAQKPGGVLLSVQDTGIGISPEHQDKVFERFYRGAGSSKDSVGIGLALSKSIIEKENGTVTAENAKTGGARFCLKFYHCHRIST